MTQFLVEINAKYDRLPEPKRFFTAIAVASIPYLGLSYLFGTVAGAIWFAVLIAMRIYVRL